MALKFILRNKKKAAFPLLSVIAGISALIITLSISNGGKEMIANDLSSLGENRVIIGGDILSTRDMKLLENYPFVQYTMFPEATLNEGEIKYIGYSKKAIKTLGLRSIKKNEVIIDKNQFPNVKMGEVISLKVNNYNKKFVVKDFYKEKNPFKLMKKGKRVILSQETFQMFFEKYNYRQMIVSFESDENPNDYINFLMDQIKRNKGVSYNIEVLETPEVFKKVIKIKKMVNITLKIISVVSLLIGAFGIFNLIGNNIKMRSSYIGILRAMGMETRRIVRIFILESSIIASLGSIIGIILGTLGSFIIAKLININPVFNIFQISLSLFLSLSMGILLGVYPTRSLMEENIVEMLKGE